jgi:hypothetical protein
LCRIRDEVKRSVLPLLVATGVALAGLASALILHDHHFVATFHVTVNGVPRSYRDTTLPLWRDPLAVLCVLAGVMGAVWIVGRRQRLELPLAAVGCAFAGAVYVHQQSVHTFDCPPFVIGCPLVLPPPDLWHYTPSLLIMAAGLAVAVALLLPRRWMVAHRLHPRRG